MPCKALLKLLKLNFYFDHKRFYDEASKIDFYNLSWLFFSQYGIMKKEATAALKLLSKQPLELIFTPQNVETLLGHNFTDCGIEAAQPDY